MKNKLKESSFIRENYRRLRKISLHLIHGRIYQAATLANHYNPVHRILIKSSFYSPYRQKKNLGKVLKEVYSYPDTDRNKKYKVALVLRDGHFFPRSSSFIRLISPLSDDAVREKIELNILSSLRLPANIDADFVIIQRTAFNDVRQAQKLLEQVKNSKIIVDNDDAFHQISEEHPEYAVQIKRVEAMEYLLQKSDQIWVSTDELVENRYKAKTKVITNSLDPRLWETKKIRTKNKGPIQMVYMGTATHDADLAMIIPALDKVHEKHPDSFQLTTIGVSQNVPERTWITQLNTPRFGSLYPNFVEWFLSQGPFDIGLSPLVDSAFNRSKSDIKCLDYLAAGITPVVSDILPYQSKEIENFIIKIKNDEASWLNRLSSIVANPNDFRNRVEEIIPSAQKYIWQNRSCEQTAKKLLKNLDELAD